MKIEACHIVQSFDMGGIEKLVFDLIEKSLHGKFHYTVICIDDKGRLASMLEEKGVEVVALNKTSGIDISLIFRLARLFKERNIKVVHNHNLGPAFYGGLAARIAGIPAVIYSGHGIDPKMGIKRKILQRFSFMLQDRIVAVSEKALHFMIERESVPADKTIFIENGIDLNPFKLKVADRDAVLKKYKLPHTENMIGIIARLHKVKDIPTLIDAFRMIAQERDDTCLVIVGEGEERHPLEKKVGDAGLSDKVFFLGEQTQISELLAIFSVFVLSSVSESSPISIMEAMAAGLPVVATNVGGNAKLVTSGSGGFIVEPRDAASMKDAILKIIENKGLAVKMGECNKKIVFSKYNIENTLRKYEDLYTQTLACSSKGL